MQQPLIKCRRQLQEGSTQSLAAGRSLVTISKYLPGVSYMRELTASLFTGSADRPDRAGPALCDILS